MEYPQMNKKWQTSWLQGAFPVQDHATEIALLMLLIGCGKSIIHKCIFATGLINWPRWTGAGNCTFTILTVPIGLPKDPQVPKLLPNKFLKMFPIAPRFYSIEQHKYSACSGK